MSSDRRDLLILAVILAGLAIAFLLHGYAYAFGTFSLGCAGSIYEFISVGKEENKRSPR